jgi:heme exporter protein D
MVASWVLVVFTVVSLAAIVFQDWSHQKEMHHVVAQERMRQDLLLNRLATRSLPEYRAAAEAQQLVETVPAPPAPKVRHLYDATGLIEVVGPGDMDDDAYEDAGSL